MAKKTKQDLPNTKQGTRPPLGECKLPQYAVPRPVKFQMKGSR